MGGPSDRRGRPRELDTVARRCRPAPHAPTNVSAASAASTIAVVAAVRAPRGSASCAVSACSSMPSLNPSRVICSIRVDAAWLAPPALPCTTTCPRCRAPSERHGNPSPAAIEEHGRGDRQRAGNDHRTSRRSRRRSDRARGVTFAFAHRLAQRSGPGVAAVRDREHRRRCGRGQSKRDQRRQRRGEGAVACTPRILASTAPRSNAVSRLHSEQVATEERALTDLERWYRERYAVGAGAARVVHDAVGRAGAAALHEADLPAPERIGLPGEYPFTRGVYPTCTAGGCGRCASSPASAPRRRPTSASATCSTTARRGSRRRSTCRALMGHDSDHAALGGRGRARGRRDRHARRHGDAVRRDRPRRGQRVDDDQRAGGDHARVLRRRGGGERRAGATGSAARSRPTS